MPIIDKYYDAGYRAFDNLKRKTCPYKLESSVNAWLEGWCTAEYHLIEYERILEEDDEENIHRGAAQEAT